MKFNKKNELPLSKKQLIVFLLIILTLSSFIHLWNPVGFPDIFFDEGIYMRRALNMLDGHSLQESYFYDHPYFGQLFLAGILSLTGYPNSLQVDSQSLSISLLYTLPRIFMGILAVIDTFLLFKIAEKKFGQKTAIFSSLLFSVMPITWMLRGIFLDALLLPFLLLSILLSLMIKNSRMDYVLILFSGISLGIAIFTKVPIIMAIPLVAYCVYSQNKNWKKLGLWFIPVIIIPLIWPAFSISLGQFDLFIKDAFWQVGREGAGLAFLAERFLTIDPILFVMGISGIIYAAIIKNKFILFWIIPFFIFFTLVGYTQYFHWIPILPIFCIAAAVVFFKITKKLSDKIQHIQFIFIAIILVTGFTSTTLLITTDLSSAQFEALAFVVQNYKDVKNTTILASPVYSWILSDIFDMENVLLDYSIILFEPIKTEKILIISDVHYMLDFERGSQISDAYFSTKSIKEFKGNVIQYDTNYYPYQNFKVTHESSLIEIRTNFDD